MHVVVLERNKVAARKVARVFLTLGNTVTLLEDPAQLASAGEFSVLCADVFDGDACVEILKSRPSVEVWLWTAEPLRRSLRYMIDAKRINHVFARKDFENPPRLWELLMVAKRRTENAVASPPLGNYLDWGASQFELAVASTAKRDDAVGLVQNFVSQIGVPKRVSEMFGELAHELLMNAMYDAPVDANGAPLFAADRKAEISLTAGQQPLLAIGTDATKLAMSVRDPFGRLLRRHVVEGMHRGLSSGEMDQSHGGAGLGMMVCHNSAGAMFFDVVANRATTVTAIFELDQNLREFRTTAKSLHFFASENN